MALGGDIKTIQRKAVMLLDIKVLASSSAGNCYIVSDTQTSIMIECGVAINKIREGCGFKIHEIDACLVSHEH